MKVKKEDLIPGKLLVLAPAAWEQDQNLFFWMVAETGISPMLFGPFNPPDTTVVPGFWFAKKLAGPDDYPTAISPEEWIEEEEDD